MLPPPPHCHHHRPLRSYSRRHGDARTHRGGGGRAPRRRVVLLVLAGIHLYRAGASAIVGIRGNGHRKKRTRRAELAHQHLERRIIPCFGKNKNWLNMFFQWCLLLPPTKNCPSSITCTVSDLARSEMDTSVHSFAFCICVQSKGRHLSVSKPTPKSLLSVQRVCQPRCTHLSYGWPKLD